MVIKTETKIPEKWANPEILKWARLRMGLKPQDVEELVKISADDITQWEKGISAPTLSDLESLAEVYMCPVGYFFLDSPPVEDSGLDLRGLHPDKTASLSYETHSQLEEFIRLSEYIESLTQKIGRVQRAEIGQASITEPVEVIAERESRSFGFTPEIRDSWETADDAFEFWKSVAEKKGVYVITLKLETGEVRGASRWETGQPPTILINRQDIEAATGRCFTLLHEWAHLLIKHPGTVCDFRGQVNSFNIESYANRFAAEVLVPKTEFVDYLDQKDLNEFRLHWSDTALDEIRRKFKVSRDVISILLEEIDLAPQGFYRKKRAAWDNLKPFFRGRKGVHLGQTRNMRKLKEIGLPFARLIAEAYGQGGMSKLEMAELLNMKVEQAEKFASCIQK